MLNDPLNIDHPNPYNFINNKPDAVNDPHALPFMCDIGEFLDHIDTDANIGKWN